MEIDRIFGEALSALPPAPQSFILYFRFESDELTEQSRALIPSVLAAVKQYPVQDVVVIGLQRAMSVRQLLVRAGLNAANIQVTTVGELDPLVKTPDETPEPRNRRVEIAVR